MEGSGNPALVTLDRVTKTFFQHGSLFSKTGSQVRALDRVSFHIFAGEIFSMVGESGSGKSTCARLLVRLEEPTSGRLVFDGMDLARMDRGSLRSFRKRVQMIFQDPYQSLNPQLSVFQTVVEPLVVQKYGSHLDRERRVFEILDEVGLKPAEDFLFRYPHQLSGGQRQRVAIARAMIVDPQFLVADEPVSMLDASVQAQLLNMLLDLKDRYSLTMLFITHDLATARYLSDRIAVIYRGKIMEQGPSETVIQNPKHPYTRALIQAAPDVRRRTQDLPLPACPVDLLVSETPGGCPFSPRCPNCSHQCRAQEAALQEIEKDHYVACFLYYG